MFIADDSTIQLFQSDLLKYSNLLFYLSTLMIIYLTIFQLKRVELSEEGIFVTNYIKTFRYSFDSVESIGYENYYLYKLGFIVLKEKGNFGKKIYFLLKKKYLEEFMEKHPEPFGDMDLYL
ncbi:MAG: hypothetical protein EA362_06530 [Saprospirales bacterium]|nr:MAG: hypothetical protein EA362_06530 [Saprospirales bacterium]